MVTLGCDSHKRTHTVVAVDEHGREVASRTFQATCQGHLEVLAWARCWPDRRWALEDCRHVSRRLEGDLVVAGEAVLRVPPKLTAGARRSSRQRGKSDPIDAAAVARAALREPGLPRAQLAGREREARLLVDHREDLVQQRTQHQNRLRWHLHELEPELRLGPGALSHMSALATVQLRLQEQAGPVARLALELVELIRDLTRRIERLERELEELMPELAPTLLELQGCGAVTADVSRFRSRAAYAMNNGTAPIPASSGNRQRVRLNRGGNRQLNAALYRIALTQVRLGGPGAAYLRKQLEAGATKAEARRALLRRLSDEVYRRLLQDRGRLQPPLSAAA